MLVSLCWCALRRGDRLGKLGTPSNPGSAQTRLFMGHSLQTQILYFRSMIFGLPGLVSSVGRPESSAVVFAPQPLFRLPCLAMHAQLTSQAAPHARQ